MLKTFLLTLTITLLLTLNSNAQSCPAGYDGPFTYNYNIPGGGTIEVFYCIKCAGQTSGHFAIHISDIRVHSDPLGGVNLPVDQNGNHGIPMRTLYELIIDDNWTYCSEYGPYITQCPNKTSFPDISYGGCYSKTLVDDNPLDPQQSWYYEPCGPWWLVQFCYAEVEVCYDKVIIPPYDETFRYFYYWGDPEPAFDCEGECFPICN